MVEVVCSCPLGHTCEEARDGKIHRCAWYTHIVGANPQTGNQVDEFRCAMGWLPTLLIEVSRVGRGQVAATESFRNEMVSEKKAALGALLSAPVLLKLGRDVSGVE
jgi:hypothetical protein